MENEIKDNTQSKELLKEQTDPIDSKSIGFKEKINSFVKQNPKKTFKILFGLAFFSFLISLTGYFYTKNVVKPKSEQEFYKTNKEIISSGSTSTNSAIGTVKNAFEMKKHLDELEFYKNKKELTKEDSLRIEYLIDKYKLNEK